MHACESDGSLNLQGSTLGTDQKGQRGSGVSRTISADSTMKQEVTETCP